MIHTLAFHFFAMNETVSIWVKPPSICLPAPDNQIGRATTILIDINRVPIISTLLPKHSAVESQVSVPLSAGKKTETLGDLVMYIIELRKDIKHITVKVIEQCT